jgi:hypothetical protein
MFRGEYQVSCYPLYRASTSFLNTMRRVIVIASSLMVLSLVLVTSVAAQDAQFLDVWVEHNYYKNSVKGMNIHTQFVVEGLYRQTGHIAAYFYYANGDALLDFNDQYNSADGKVSVGREFTPGYQNTRYDDLTLFIPYDELHMEEGESSLEFQVTIFYLRNGEWTALAQSESVRFDYRSGDIEWNSENVPETSLSAGFTPDPFTRTLSNNIFGGFEISDVSDCAGYVSPTPDFRIRWSGNSSFLRIYFIGDSDTVMLINDSSGAYYCDDDSFDTLHPSISFSNPSAGQYDIWIGTYVDGGNVDGTLYITELADLHP